MSRRTPAAATPVRRQRLAAWLALMLGALVVFLVSQAVAVGRAAGRRRVPGGRSSSRPGTSCRGAGLAELSAAVIAVVALVVFVVVMLASESLRVLLVTLAAGRRSSIGSGPATRCATRARRPAPGSTPAGRSTRC